MTEVRSSVVQVGSSEVHVLAAGDPDRRDLLLLHGAAFRAETWRELGTLEHLAQSELHAVAVDLPGYGESPPSKLARDEFLLDLCDALALEAPLVVSPSMSGAFSLPFVARHPGRVSGFVPIAPAAVADFEAELKGSSVPTLVLWGSQDQIFPPDRAEPLAACFEASRVVLFEGARHPCYLDAPELFHDWLVRFARDPRGILSGNER